MQQHSTDTVTIRARSICSTAAAALLDPENNICAVAFDANGMHVLSGPRSDILSDADLRIACDGLTDTMLAMLNLGLPTRGVLIIQSERHALISGIYMPDAVLSLCDVSATCH